MTRDLSTLTFKQAAADAHLSERYLRNEIRAGRLPVLCFGRARRIARRDWERWIESHRKDATESIERAA
jgi:excisionase family DNA binding protein